MKEDQRNILIFAILAAFLLIGWPMIAGRLFPAANPPATVLVNGKSVAVANPAADPTADSPRALRDRAIVLAETPRIKIDTPLAARLDQPQGRADRRSRARQI